MATASGLLASVFAVSRNALTMLTEMKMIPHSHFGMSGSIRDHALVYTVVLASVLAIFFDLTRIAVLGAFFYLIMDILIHWALRRLRQEIGARSGILITAIALDTVVLGVFGALKLRSDPLIVITAVVSIAVAFARAALPRRALAGESEAA